MSLIIKNQRIYDFYQHHPQYDFEKMNEFLIDLLEKFTEKINPSLDQTFATKLMSQMMDLQTSLLKQQSDNQLNYYKHVRLLVHFNSHIENSVSKSARAENRYKQSEK